MDIAKFVKLYPADEIPLKSLTEEDINGMCIHMTEGALRRALAVKPNKMYDTNSSEIEGAVPTLYYREEIDPENPTKEIPNPEYNAETNPDVPETIEVPNIEYSIQALSADILKYLLKKDAESQTEPEP